MQAEDRIIHFSAELIHAPKPQKKDVLQGLYYELTRTKAAYDSTDFTVPGQARFYSRRDSRSQSICLFLPDRVLLVEEWADIPLSGFLDRVHEVAERTLAVRGIERYLAHACTIRSTFALTYFDDARVFLLDHVCGQEGLIGPHFQRPIAVGGLRFVLPETHEHDGMLTILIESWRHSRNEVFVEVKGVFGRKPVGAGETQTILNSIRSVRTFIATNVYPYLNQHDVPKEAENE